MCQGWGGVCLWGIRLERSVCVSLAFLLASLALPPVRQPLVAGVRHRASKKLRRVRKRQRQNRKRGRRR